MDKIKVLIADDDFENRDILKMRLEQAGYSVTEVENGDQALARIAAEPFGLVVLDVMMPKKDGWQVCKALKSDPKTAAIPVVVLTARTEAIDELRSFESGADEYLQKPVDHQALLALIHQLLDKETDSHAAR